MDFFERQNKARRQTRYLVVMFLLAVAGIVLAVDLVVTTLVANLGNDSGQLIVPDLVWAREHVGLVTLTSLATAGFIGMASLFRVAGLSAGGGSVARGLGGTLVVPDTSDPLRRRLHNVVEEMAIASGVPVPDVYVLEQEAGLNAFAAGFTPSDAAIAVTRGSLDSFSRSELQGVIAHEFSHILNGDMRLNMRLIGILFGILAISLIGRTILRSARHMRVRSRDSRKAGGVAVILLTGLALTLIGYLGLFFGRMIKAGVSRQREYLADASAVQFTRQTEGIAGALKKIGFGAGSHLEDADGEEVSHMLFASGVPRLATLFATHPPIVERIRALEPHFDPVQYEREALAARAQPVEAPGPAREPGTGAREAQARLEQLLRTLLVLTPATVSETVGNPSAAQLRHASDLRRLIHPTVYAAAQSPAGAILLTVALLLHADEAMRDRQTTRLAALLTPDQVQAIKGLYPAVSELGIAFRLPLLELAFPALKRRPHEQIRVLLESVHELIGTDGRVDTFEYLLSRALISLLRDAAQPPRRRSARRARLTDSSEELHILFSVVAFLGHKDDAQTAREAYHTGMRTLLSGANHWPEYAEPAGWIAKMDAALEKLDSLPAMGKQALVQALSATISHDNQVTISEAELLRAVCAVLHCPLPPLLGGTG
jgi:Zn-dependent protease with chaperone function